MSKQEKTWVYFHPFKAKRAYKISKKVERTTDSITKTKRLGTKRIVGNRIDAFKHTLWMWALADEIGCNAAASLGRAHEKGNYSMYKEHQLEDGALPDKASSDMDTFNNNIGIQLYKEYKKKKPSYNEKIKRVILEVKKGTTKMLHQNKKGEFLDKNGNIIPLKDFVGKWENRRCLISTQINNRIGNNQLNSLHLLQQNNQQ
ncbi:DUF6973 domain-containing protein [Wenyingzhuangia sp. IMCC45574]